MHSLVAISIPPLDTCQTKFAFSEARPFEGSESRKPIKLLQDLLDRIEIEASGKKGSEAPDVQNASRTAAVLARGLVHCDEFSWLERWDRNFRHGPEIWRRRFQLQQCLRNRSTHASMTSPGSRLHQFSAENTSTSQRPS